MSPGPPQRPTRRQDVTPSPSNNGVAMPDYPLIVILAIMMALGLVMVYSASFATQGTRFFLRQILWIIIGVMAAFVMARIPYFIWRRLAIPIMLVALTGLVAVLFAGDPINGARRTFFGSIQPSEFAKLAVVIYISAWVASKGEKLADYRGGLIPFTIIMGLVTLLLVLEPSFSVAIIILTIGFTIFFVGGGDVKQMLTLAVIAAPALLLLLQRSGYGIKRVEDWLQEFWNLEEAAGTIGGPVPLPWSDYLFAHIGTHLGFITAVVVVGLYAALCYRCLGIALNAPDKFGVLMAVGITTWIMVQTAIHMGTSLALIPKTGQPLPLMSYGGSSMLMCMAAMGLMQSIARASPAKKALYASFVIGGRDRRPRVSDSGSSQRAGERVRQQPGTATQRKPIQPKTRKPGRGTTGTTRSSGPLRRRAGVSYGYAAPRARPTTLRERLHRLGRRTARPRRRTNASRA
jgi:cell division protein FtsW